MPKTTSPDARRASSCCGPASVRAEPRAWRHTLGALPELGDEQVWLTYTLNDLATYWPSDVDWIAVNAGTPAEVIRPADQVSRDWWIQIATRKPANSATLADDYPAFMPMLTYASGPTRGSSAFGFAIGAFDALRTGMPWNYPGPVYGDYIRTRKSLREMWSIDSRETWDDALTWLLDDRAMKFDAQTLLHLRNGLRVRTADAWLTAIGRLCREMRIDDEAQNRLRDLARRILRYEARFRTDGLLAPDARVRDTVGWDFGRAVMIARTGHHMGWCTDAEMRDVVEAAGRQAARFHTSWQDYAAGFILARVLHFDEDAFGTWYTHSVADVRALYESSSSPWHSVPWPAPTSQVP